MPTVEALENKLGDILDPKRFRHSVMVKETAVRMALRHGADPTKAALAGLLHDVARPLSDAELLRFVVDFDIVVDSVERENSVLLHAPVGAEMVRREFNIDDCEVLEAIRWHTVGRPSMSLLAQIIYLADYIEPGRRFPGVQTMRRLESRTLPGAVLYAMDSNIRYLLRRGAVVHPSTILARNDLLRRV